MPFRITARTLLELGAELISSDAVALYELVKNALDAGSPTVAIKVQAVVRRSAYGAALDGLSARRPTREVLAELRRHVVGGAPTQARDRFLSALEACVGHRTAFRRALKDAYAAENWIEVADTGHGMSAAGLEDDFLTIGTRSRRRMKVSRSGRPLAAGQELLGDKGVGRLSTMRLGERLSVVTSTAGEDRWNELHIDWNRFSHESDAMLEDVDVAPTVGRAKRRPSSSGTTIRISALKSDWDAQTFSIMVSEQFSRIIDPLPPDPDAPGDGATASPDDLFELEFNGTPVELEGVPAWLLANAHAHVAARYDLAADGEPRLAGVIEYTLRNQRTTFHSNETELVSLTDPIARRVVRSTPRALRDLGPFTMSFYWYNRRILEDVSDGVRTLKRADFVKGVRKWGGGLMLFRNGFRINPYGSGDDDWLELDKKALGASGYKVNRAQIIGHVSLTSRNHRLVEQTNREGLVDNEYKRVLVAMLRHVLITEFRTYIEGVDEARRVRDLTTTEQLDARIGRTKDQAERSLLELQRAVPGEKDRIQELRGLVKELGVLMDQTRRMAAEYEDDKAKFTQLAGIGLMVEFILHEIGRATVRSLDVVSQIDQGRLAGPDASAVRTLVDQLRTLRKRIDNLDPLSTSRRQVPEHLDVVEVVRQVLEGRAAQFERHGIRVAVDAPSDAWPMRAVRGMLIGILENLVENAVYWLNVEASVRRRFEPRIDVLVDRASGEIAVTDNGPGVDARRAEQIFEPFVTSKPSGEGRGLGLYIAREMAKPHGWSIAMADVGRIHPDRLNTFVVELGRTG